MKKRHLLSILFILVLGFFVLTSCTEKPEDPVIDDIVDTAGCTFTTTTDQDSLMYDFDLTDDVLAKVNNVTVKVYDQNSLIVEQSFTTNKIVGSVNDLTPNKLYKVVIYYGDDKVLYTHEIKTEDLFTISSDDYVFEDKTFIYDGTAKSLELVHGLSNATVTYENNNQILPGTYEVTATLNVPLYKELKVKANLIITALDFTGITFNDNTFTYDGLEKSLSVLGAPEGATITYENNNQVLTGDYTVTAHISKEGYNDLKLTANLKIIPTVFENVKFEDQVLKYDGAIKELSVVGAPEDATITYTNNANIEVGTYQVTAVIKKQGYSDLTLTANLTILPQTLGVTLDNKTVDYTGEVISLSVNNLPDYATVTYENNENKLPGEYTVKAVVKSQYYDDLTLSATLTINALTFTATMDDVIVDYDGMNHSVNAVASIEGTKVTYTNNKHKLPGEYEVSATLTKEGYNDVTVTAKIIIHALKFTATLEDMTVTYDGVEHKLSVVTDIGTHSEEWTNNSGHIYPGEYNISVKVSKTGYEDVNLSAKLTINKATISASLSDNEFTYDGSAKKLEVVTSLEGVTVEYTNNNQTNAGEYTVTAKLTKDYYEVLTLTAKLTIKKATIIAELISEEFNYDGNAHSLVVLTNLEDVVIEYTNNAKVAVGEYTVSAVISKDNYETLTLSATLTIKALNFDVIMLDESFEYDGNKHSLKVVGAPEGTTITYTGNDQSNYGTYTVSAKLEKENYNTITLTASLSITKTLIKGVVFENLVVDYDGNAHGLVATNIPEGATSSYTDNSYTLPGEYDITLTVKLDNHEDLVVTKKLTIKALQFNVTFEDDIVDYDGNVHSLTVVGAPEGTTITYTDNGKTLEGTYTVKAKLEKTGYETKELEATLLINELSMNVTINPVITKYTGNAVNVELIGVVAEATVTYETYKSDNNSKVDSAILPGSYYQIVTITKAHYKTVVVQEEILIENATFDNAKLEDAYFVVDGEKKTITVSGLPTGANVEYSYYEIGNKSNKSNDGMTEKGTYHVDAVVTMDNYEQLKLEATMTIGYAQVTLAFKENVTVEKYELSVGQKLDKETVMVSFGLVYNNHPLSYTKEDLVLEYYGSNEDGTIDRDNRVYNIDQASSGNYYVVIYTDEMLNRGKIKYDKSNEIVIPVILSKQEYTFNIETELTVAIGETFTYFGSLAEDAKFTYSKDILAETKPGTYSVTITKAEDKTYKESSITISVTLYRANKATDLFISEFGIIGTSSALKYVCVYNGTGADVNLSGYSLKAYQNGSTSAQATITFTEDDILKNGEILTIANKANDKLTLNSAKVITNSSFIVFNGDDAIVLFKGTEKIDMFGVICATDKIPFGNYTLKNVGVFRRSIGQYHPTIIPSNVGKESWNANEWTYMPYEENLGSYSMDISKGLYSIPSFSLEDNKFTSGNPDILDITDEYKAYLPKIEYFDADGNKLSAEPSAPGKFYVGFSAQTITVNGEELSIPEVKLEYGRYVTVTPTISINGTNFTGTTKTLTYNGNEHKVLITATSAFKVTVGDDVIDSVLNNDKYEVEVKVMTPNTYSIKIDVLESDYVGASTKTITVTINKGSTPSVTLSHTSSVTTTYPNTVEFYATSKVEIVLKYFTNDENEQTVTAVKTDDTYKVSLTLSNVGKYTITVLSTDTNYSTYSKSITVTINPKSVTPTFKLNGANIQSTAYAYGPEYTLTITLDVPFKVGDVEATLTDGVYVYTQKYQAEGEYTVNLTVDSTYKLSKSTVTFSIAKIRMANSFVVKNGEITLNNDKTSYNVNTDGYTFTISNSGSVAYTVKINDVVTTITNNQFTLTTVGTYTIVLHSNQTDDYNECTETYIIEIKDPSTAPTTTTYDFTDKRYDQTACNSYASSKDDITSIKLTQPQTTGSKKGICVGAKSSAGTIVFTFAKKVKSIKITYCGWTASGNDASTCSKAIVKVNSGESKEITSTSQTETYTFDTATNTVTVTSQSGGYRFFILSIEVEFE